MQSQAADLKSELEAAQQLSLSHEGHAESILLVVFSSGHIHTCFAHSTGNCTWLHAKLDFAHRRFGKTKSASHCLCAADCPCFSAR